MQLNDAPQQGEAWWARFEGLLDEQTEWPTDYIFKFIVPHEQLDALRDAIGEEPQDSVRASSKGTYVSLTAHRRVASSEEVVALYRSTSDVDGVIAL